VYCGKTADWIWMPFGVVSGIGRWMGVLHGVEIVEADGAVSGVNVGHPVVTKGILYVRGGDAALPKLLWNFLFSFVTVYTVAKLVVPYATG